MYNLTCGECLAGLVEKAILSRQTGSLGEAGISDINYEEEFMWGGQGGKDVSRHGDHMS